ncbi:MAG TPA: shikimate kinase [Chloroflexota bacterium]|nr:shikimate kinase [Chloroflexota bacterium]
MAQPERIILVGLSGSGKSTLARQISRRIGWDAVDVDSMIVESAGMPIDEIFESQGEAAFRRLEHQMLTRALERRGVIIATGGGAMACEENREAILAGGVAVYVKSSPTKCAYYLARSWKREKRPLLDSAGGPEELLGEQLAARGPFYEMAHLTLDAVTKDLRDLVDELELIAAGPATTDRNY